MSGMGTNVLAPVRKSVTAGWDTETAFRRFTARMASWWPLETRSVGRAEAETVVMEGRVGGRLYEKRADGTTSDWGVVTAWEPPGRVAFTWHPGREPDSGQSVEVTFVPTDGGTRVDLVHSGWEKLGDTAAEQREQYQSGWDPVLVLYAAAEG